jgi:hypothetical protein
MRLILIVTMLLLSADLTWGQNPTKINDLVFGSLFPGIPKVIDKKSAGEAAEFHISGNPGDEVIVNITLPTYIYQSGYNFQLSFSNTDLAIDSSASPSQSSPLVDNLNPWQPQTYRLGSNGLTLWLGGTAIPKLVQQPGNYSATITVTVDTTGN